MITFSWLVLSRGMICGQHCLKEPCNEKIRISWKQPAQVVNNSKKSNINFIVILSQYRKFCNTENCGLYLVVFELYQDSQEQTQLWILYSRYSFKKATKKK